MYSVQPRDCYWFEPYTLGNGGLVKSFAYSGRQGNYWLSKWELTSDLSCGYGADVYTMEHSTIMFKK